MDTRPKSRLLRTVLLPAAVAVLLSCSDSGSPTEPSPVPGTPAATPAPTPLPGQPATLSGTVRSYGPLLPGTAVECEGASTTTASDGTYLLSGLRSGQATVTVTYSYVTTTGATATDTMTDPVSLEPGSNAHDFLVF